MRSEHIATARFIDLDYPTWHAGALPDRLAVQFPDGLQLPAHITDFAGLELPDFETHLTRTLVACHEPRNAYHNWTHAARVVENTANAYDALQKHTGLEMPQGFLQPVLLGAAAHDCGHPGATFFSDADPERVPAGVSIDATVESYSAGLASQFAAEAGATPEQQAVAAYIPISSTYGAKEQRGKELGIERASNPSGLAGLIMRASDVVPDGGDYAASVSEDLGVLYGERRPVGSPAPTAFERYCEERKGFLRGYVLASLDKLDAAAGCDLTTHVGWRARTERRLAEMDAMQKGENPVLRSVLISRLAAQYAITLA